MNEAQLEKLCLDWFREGGWKVLSGSDITPDDANPNPSDYEQVLLVQDLQSAFGRINSHIPASSRKDCFEQVLQKLFTHENPDLANKNRKFHRLLLEGIPIQYKKNEETKNDKAFLVDFEQLENNRFVAVNQFTITGGKQHRRPDIICFINGLPIAVIELKNPTDENTDIWGAFHQLQTYKKDIPDLFIFNEALVISDGIHARIGSLTASKERFMPWRTIKNEKDKPKVKYTLETVVKGFFDKELLLDYIRFFVLFETDSTQVTKKIAGYHQFHAVREAVRATIIAAQKQVGDDNKNIRGNKKAGVVWHTQGSGKSISMCCYAGKLLQQSAMENPTIVVVTDRNDLDGQLFTTFCNAEELLNQRPVQAHDRNSLRKLLADRGAGGIIFTTVQKFFVGDNEAKHPVLNDRHNIVVISDEAHRSQYGFKATLSGEKYKYGYAQYMRDALPFASFIGFTGTPISQEDRDTRAVFGDYVSIYDIQDAVNDEATVPIYYESRLAKLDLNYAEIENLSKQVDEVIEDEEKSIQEQTKSKWSGLEKLVGATPHLKQVAKDLVAHFENHNKTMNGKAMIVAMSRNICVRLYNEIIVLRPEWHNTNSEKGAIKVVMTGTAADKELLQPHIYNAPTKTRLAERFKDASDPLKIVIVRDMWLTGFDAPCCHTMYINKLMKGHNLMQAIARVNRVFKDKPGGLVVDYIGIASELKRALKIYTDSNGKGAPTIDIEKSFAIFRQQIEIIRGMFAKTPQSNGLDISGFETNAQTLLLPATNHILGLKDGKHRFFNELLIANKAYALCSTLEEAKEFKKEMAFYCAIKITINKFANVDKKRTQDEKNSILQQILDNAIISEGVEDIFELCNLKKPNIGLLSDEFLDDIRKIPHPNLAVALLEKLIKEKIKAKTLNNIIKEKKYADRLQETLLKYNNKIIETSQVIEELIEMAKYFQVEMQQEAELGLDPDEIAFYDALANNESAVRELGDETLKKIAVEITYTLRKSTTLDWQKRESVRARLRNLVRHILKRWKYPPDKEIEAINLVIKQTETLSNRWTEKKKY